MKLTLLITTYNRPEYLAQCFKSLLKVKYSKGTSVMIIDDASTDSKTIDLINEFEPILNKENYLGFNRVPVSRFQNAKNSGIRSSLIFGYDKAFTDGAQMVINLDGDMIVKTDFIDRLAGLKNQFKNHIICGINCTMSNKNGQIRYPILFEQDNFILKSKVGGSNLCISNEDYQKWVKPALAINGNWDHNASNYSMKDNKPIVVCKPSVSQHIGIQSSMGHVYEKADVSDDFKLD